MTSADLTNKLGKKSLRSIHDLKNAISTTAGNNPNFCLLLGAGASVSSGVRTAGQMVEEWRKDQFISLNPDIPVPDANEIKKWLRENEGDWYDETREYASLIERRFSLPVPRRIFIEEEVAEKVPSIGYSYLVRLAESGSLRTIFTTNFDDLLNEAFYQFSSQRPIVCAHDSSVSSVGITTDRAKIIKLHGDYLFEDIKNTQSETRDLNENMKLKMQEFLKEYGLIVVGYSGGDRSIMKLIEEMLDNDNFLKTGLYWCFRKDDNIDQSVIDLFHKRDNVFYVFIDGFDEMMADLHDRLIDSGTPFNSRIANDRATKLIDGYLSNIALQSSKSTVIKRHLADLGQEKNNSLISDALREMQGSKQSRWGISDGSMVAYLEVEKAIRSRNIDKALKLIESQLKETQEREFKEVLLQRRFTLSRILNLKNDARQAADEMLKLEPQNYFCSMASISLIEKRSERLIELEKLRKANPQCPAVLNEYGDELEAGVVHREKSISNKSIEDVVKVFKESCVSDPSIENPAWSRLCDIYTDQSYQYPGSEKSLGELIKYHSDQDSRSIKTSSVLLKYCKYEQKIEWRELKLFESLQKAFQDHFPRNVVAHMSVFADACIEFDQFGLLRKFFEENSSEVQSDELEEFISLIMRISYDVFRDREQAVKYGEKYLETSRSPRIEQQLLWLHVHDGNLSKARTCLGNLENSINLSTRMNLEADILEREGNFQDAIDLLLSIPDKSDYDEMYGVKLTYLELKKGDYEAAFERSRKFLDARSFSIRFGTDIINYEFAKTRLQNRKKIDKSRLSKIVELKSGDRSVKGVAHLLLEDKKSALEVFSKEAEKRFSWFDSYTQWPVMASVQPEILSLKEKMFKAKRTFSLDNSKLSLISK